MNEVLNSLGRADFVGTTSPTPTTVIFIIFLAFAAGLVIGFVYMWTHEALSYSRTFVGALAMLPLLVAMMMVAMAGSLIVAFGLLGVFGVVRFRNVLKDTRDTTFILWANYGGTRHRHHALLHRPSGHAGRRRSLHLLAVYFVWHTPSL